MRKTPWQYLFEIISNESTDLPLEMVTEFKKIVSEHTIEAYVDYIRGIKIWNIYAEEPWEWEYLKLLSENLHNDIEVVVLKGSAAKDLNLYPYPGLRQSDDLDIYIHNIKSWEEKISFINLLTEKKIFLPEEDWKHKLKRHNSIIATYEDNLIDIHFSLFNNMSLICSMLEKDKINLLTKDIIKRCTPFKSLKNIKKMSVEDFWLYCIFHFVVNYPKIYFNSILDSYLLIKNNPGLIKPLKEHSERSNQLFLFKTGLFILSQVDKNIKPDNPSILIKKIYDLSLIFNRRLSIKEKLATCFSKTFLACKGDFLPFCLLLPFYLPTDFFNHMFTNSIEINPFSKTTISNLLNKLLYLTAKVKDKIKRSCIDLSKAYDQKSHADIKIIETNKELITIDIHGVKLTFEVPSEFIKDLKSIWDGFITSDHLKEKIVVEKIEPKNNNMIRETVCRDGRIYTKLLDDSFSIFGEANTNSSGRLYAKTFWDLRTCSLDIFKIITCETENMLAIHAGAVDLNNKTIIFPAISGAGKTTLFNLLTKDGTPGINDDTILLKKDSEKWFAYPTPFMSKSQKPLKSEKKLLEGIIDPIKVCGGHEIKSIPKEKAIALLLNNIPSFIADDGGYIFHKTAKKILDLSSQITLTGELKYSLEDSLLLKEMIKEWMLHPNKIYSSGKVLTHLVEVTGTSMEPTFKEGNILTVKKVNPLELKRKDVICYTKHSDGLPIIHRVHFLIKHKKQTTVITKGDNNIYLDEPQIFKSNQDVLKVTGRFK